MPFISTYNPNNPNIFPKVRAIYGSQINQLSKQQNAEKVDNIKRETVFTDSTFDNLNIKK